MIDYKSYSATSAGGRAKMAKERYKVSVSPGDTEGYQAMTRLVGKSVSKGGPGGKIRERKPRAGWVKALIDPANIGLITKEGFDVQSCK